MKNVYAWLLLILILKVVRLLWVYTLFMKFVPVATFGGINISKNLSIEITSSAWMPVNHALIVAF